MTKRPTTPEVMSHGFHADNCEFSSPLFLGDCVEKESSCCSWRSHTLFLYLREADGGDFFFYDPRAAAGEEYTRVKPAVGRLLMMTSGGENVHGVSGVRSGYRYAVGMWCTTDSSRSEDSTIMLDNWLDADDTVHIDMTTGT